MVVEFIGGFITNSLALISDAGHMLSDHGCAYGCYHDYAYAQNDHGYDHVQSGYVCDLVYGCAKTFYSTPDYGSN